jgi:hypothetical protein
MALTTDKLQKLLVNISTAAGGSAYNATAYKAALTMGVYMLLRVSELVAPTTTTHDRNRYLNIEDIEVLPSIDDPRWLRVNIKVSKTDVYREGVELKVATNDTATCPVLAMADWLRVRLRSHPKEPAFTLADGSFMTRGRLQSTMQEGLRLAGFDQRHYTSHSMRSGGATSLACANWPAETIMLLGRWSSDCYVRYLRFDDNRRRRVSASIRVTTEVVTTATSHGLVGEQGWLGD